MWDYGSQFTSLKGFRFNFTTFFSFNIYVTFLGDLCLFDLILYSSTHLSTVGISVSIAEACDCATGGRKWLQTEFWVLQKYSNSTKQQKFVLLFLIHQLFYSSLIFMICLPSCLLINHVTNICHVWMHLCLFAAT